VDLEYKESTCSDKQLKDISLKKKKTFENFFISYNKLIKKIENLMNEENTLKLDEIVII